MASQRSSSFAAPCAPRAVQVGGASAPLTRRSLSHLRVTTHAPSCSSVARVRGRPDGRHSLSRALSVTQTHGGRLPADLPLGSARLACARPAVVGRSLRHACCNPWAVARLAPRSFRHRGRWTFTPLSIGQHSPAHAPSRLRRDRASVPPAYAKTLRRVKRTGNSRAVAPRISSRRWPAAPRAAEGPTAAAVTRALARLCRSSAGGPAVPRKAGAKYIHPRRSQRHECAHARRSPRTNADPAAPAG